VDGWVWMDGWMN